MSSERWALILGASSGFGAAAAKALAKAGFGIFGVHLDRRSTMQLVEELIGDIEACGQTAIFFNINASSEDKRQEVIERIKEAVGGAPAEPAVRVLMHSLAFGTLKPFTSQDEQVITKPQMDMTLDVMAHSLVYWAQDVVGRGLMAAGGRIFAMTSSGSTRVIPSYGAVSAAKCALESHIRQLATELAPRGITANALRGGVTDTPAARKIPGSERLFEEGMRRNPHGRLTTPGDVARAVVALSTPGADWITGNVINVDGGEEISGG